MLGAKTGIGHVPSVVVLASLAAATWIWPLLIYRGTESEAVHLDEGLFVAMDVVLPPAGTVLAFAVATVISQVVRRRPLVKSVFNFGQVLTAVGVALLTVEVLSPASTSVQPATVAAATAGAVAFFVVNTAAIAAILAVTGTASLKAAVRDGAEIRVLLVAACISSGPSPPWRQPPTPGRSC